MQWLRRLEEYLLILLVTVMSMVTLAQVVLRFVLNNPPSWSEELARYLLVWITMIGAAVAVDRKAHFGMDVLTTLFPPVLRRWTRLFSYASVGLFAGLMVRYGWQLVQLNTVQRSPALDLPMSLPYAALPVAGLLILIHVAAQVWSELRGRDKA